MLIILSPIGTMNDSLIPTLDLHILGGQLSALPQLHPHRRTNALLNPVHQVHPNAPLVR